MVAAFRWMLERDRKRMGFTVGQVAWRLGISPAEYRELVDGDGWPSFEVYDRIERLFGWPQAFVASGSQSGSHSASPRPS